MFDCEPAERAASPSGVVDTGKSASQPRQDSGGDAVSDGAHAARGMDTDSAAPDWLATQAAHAPDWLATQAVTEIAPIAQMAASQPFPFDFAALLHERPKQTSGPSQAKHAAAAAKESLSVFEGEDVVPDVRRCSASLPSPNASWFLPLLCTACAQTLAHVRDQSLSLLI